MTSTSTVSQQVSTLAREVGVPLIERDGRGIRLVEEIILARLGVGLLPLDRPSRAGITVIPLKRPAAVNRTYVWTRQGRATWPPLALLLDKLTQDGRPRAAGSLAPPGVQPRLARSRGQG